MISYLGPLLGAVEVDQLQKESVLDISPWPFDKGWVEHLLPPVKALHIGPPGESLGNLFPVFPPVHLDSLGQFLIFNLCPVPLDLDMVALSMVLGSLVLGWPPLVEMGVKHLVSDQLLLSFPISQIIQIVLCFNFEFTRWIL